MIVIIKGNVCFNREEAIAIYFPPYGSHNDNDKDYG